MIVLMESHGDFTRSADIEDVLTRVASPQLALLWDAHHSFAAAGEQPADTFKAIGRWARHSHLKDSVPNGAAAEVRAARQWRHPGQGAGPRHGVGR